MGENTIIYKLTNCTQHQNKDDYKACRVMSFLTIVTIDAIIIEWKVDSNSNMR
jgi:hypothetical protein